jgi:hypothetical protein
MTTNKNQIGGTHYKDMALEPWEIIERCDLDFWEGNIIKYVLRWKSKDGIKDLMKARHYLDKRECSIMCVKLDLLTC